MTDVQVEETTETQTVQNPGVQGTSTQVPVSPGESGNVQVATTTTRIGRTPGVEIIWLIAGIIDAVLALDFIFHAAGANSVGFSAFIYAIGTFFAAPFAGIFNTTYAAAGNLVIWADVLGIVIYSLIALGLVKLVAVAFQHSRTNTNM